MLFSIEIIEQGWLEGCLPEEEPCSHGRIQLNMGGRQITSGEEDYGISESALALLRTLGSYHSKQKPVADRLLFHGCGTLLMMGCPIGVNWSVTHSPAHIRIGEVVRYDTTNEDQAVTFPGLTIEISREEYSRQVVAFAVKAKELFTGIDKEFYDDFDRRQYEAFWAEFDLYLSCQHL